MDPTTQWLWAGDVGQNAWEEIDIIEKGKNYGWRTMEGNHCYSPSTGCDQTGLTLPVWEYGHTSTGGFSVTGGYVYRGAAIPELYGKYVYGDFVSGRIWFLSHDGTNPPVNELFNASGLGISSFGLDEQKELYLCAFDGKVYKFVKTSPTFVQDASPGRPSFSLKQNYPNPFNPSTNIEFTVGTYGHTSLRVFNMLGQEVTKLFDGILSAGIHQVRRDGTNWAGESVPSGVYFLRLVSAQAAESRRMILLR